MPVAAVPNYLGSDFSDASPGMRFGMYLPIWTAQKDRDDEVRERAKSKDRQNQSRQTAELWSKSDSGARAAWRQVTALSPRDQDLMKGLALRQSALASTVPAEGWLGLEALSVAPFVTGLGNEHPLENGFAFLNPYGLPYLPGSGVKGVLRQAARELASGEWGDSQGWDTVRHLALKTGRDEIGFSIIDALFGLESVDGGKQHLHGAMTFLDVIPQIKGGSLAVDIMTPHQGHYYQRKRDQKAGNSDSPHESGQPNPISFLTVPPGSGFAFHVLCDLAHLGNIAPTLARDGQWKKLLRAAFVHAFDWLGFGAKTSVGYGAMQEDPEAGKRAVEQEKKRAAEKAAMEKEARLEALGPNARRIEEMRAVCAARLEEQRGRKDSPNQVIHNGLRDLVKVAKGWNADERRAVADLVEEWLPKLVVEGKNECRKLGLDTLRGA